MAIDYRPADDGSRNFNESVLHHFKGAQHTGLANVAPRIRADAKAIGAAKKAGGDVEAAKAKLLADREARARNVGVGPKATAKLAHLRDLVKSGTATDAQKNKAADLAKVVRAGNGSKPTGPTNSFGPKPPASPRWGSPKPGVPVGTPENPIENFVPRRPTMGKGPNGQFAGG